MNIRDIIILGLFQGEKGSRFEGCWPPTYFERYWDQHVRDSTTMDAKAKRAYFAGRARDGFVGRANDNYGYAHRS